MILVIGDMHFKDSLSYSEYIFDGRKAEKKEILDFIVKSAEDCDTVVFLGDNFNGKNNSSEVNREFVEFLGRFLRKKVIVLSGNHEKRGDGKTAIDFLGEFQGDIDNVNWSIFTTKRGTLSFVGKPQSVGMSALPKRALLKCDFLPYMTKSELGVETNEEGSAEIMEQLTGGDILFCHHNISGTSFNGVLVDSLPEILLPKDKLEKKYKLIMAGHIHSSGVFGKTILSGSVFNSEVGETGKSIWKIKDDLTVEEIKLPGRGIYKLEDPTQAEINAIPNGSIVKVIITKKGTDIEVFKKNLEKAFDACLIIENYPSERKKMKIGEGAAFDFSVEAVLKLYSESKSVDLNKLMKGLLLIK